MESRQREFTVQSDTGLKQPEQFAALNQVRPQSVRARICRTGSYFGVVPKKLANGRLAFPAVQVSK